MTAESTSEVIQVPMRSIYGHGYFLSIILIPAI
jgi:hypothetical protein